MTTNNYVVKSASELPTPVLTRTFKLDSDFAQVRNLHHVFKVPIIGEYMYNFKLEANPLLLAKYQGQAPMNLPTYTVDCVNNYIESVSISTNPEVALSTITEISKCAGACTDLPTNMSQPLDFFKGMPLIAGALWDSDLYITIKFRAKPPSKYFITFEYGLLNNSVVSTFHNSCITVQIANTVYGIIKYSTFKYENGRLHTY